MSFAGFVALESTIKKTVIAKNSSLVPINTDTSPLFRIYGPSGFMASGSLAAQDSGTITNCPPANPTVYTSNGHGLTVGTRVTITNIGGNTGANVTGDITAVTTNTFTIAVDTSAGSAYTSGGNWQVTGAYLFSYQPQAANNFAAGTIYTVFVYGKISSVNSVVDAFTFSVT